MFSRRHQFFINAPGQAPKERGLHNLICEEVALDALCVAALDMRNVGNVLPVRRAWQCTGSRQCTRALPYLRVPSSHHAISGGNTHVDESNLNMGYFERWLQGIYHVSKDDNYPQELLRDYSLVDFLPKSLWLISACV